MQTPYVSLVIAIPHIKRVVMNKSSYSPVSLQYPYTRKSFTKTTKKSLSENSICYPEDRRNYIMCYGTLVSK